MPDPVAASLRIACDALRASPVEVTCIGMVSRLPHDFVITELMEDADRLADGYGFRTHMYVHEGWLDIRFERQGAHR